MVKLNKGTALIVGKTRRDKKVEVDGIILHTAYCLSENPSLLDKYKISGEEKIIYICGHGNKEKHTIDDRRVEELADKLVKARYVGEQEIYLVSCSASEGHRGKTTVDLLNEEINRKINYKEYVKSDAMGSTVTLKGDGGLAENKVVEIKGLKKKIISQYQRKFIKRYTYRVGEIEELEEKYKESYAEINNYKKKLVKRDEQIMIGDFVSDNAMRRITLNITTMFSLVMLMGLYMINQTDISNIIMGKNICVVSTVVSILMCIVVEKYTKNWLLRGLAYTSVKIVISLLLLSYVGVRGYILGITLNFILFLILTVYHVVEEVIAEVGYYKKRKRENKKS